MAFEQFFYNGDVKLTVGGESANYRTEIFSDGTIRGYGGKHSATTNGGSLCCGEASVQHIHAAPSIDGGAICAGETLAQMSFAPLLSSAGFSNRWPSGNNIEDNIFSVLTIITEIPEGGILVGGTTPDLLRFNPEITSGVRGGGHGFSTEERIVSGGAILSGAAFVSEKDEEIGSGGIVVGGQNFWFGHVGGVGIGGAASVGVGIVGVGGVKSGGTAPEDIAYDPPSTGGAVLNGNSVNIENISVSGGALAGGRNEAAETSTGKVLLGGRATTLYDEVGVGGATLGGIAPNGTHDFASGGALVGGSVLQQITQHIDVSGVLVSGRVPEEPSVFGGAKVGGFVIQTFNEVVSGGITVGGRGIAGIAPSIGNGAILLGGRLIVGIEPGVFGGAKLHGFGVQSFYEIPDAGALIGGQGIDTQTAYHYTSDGDFIQVTQPDPNIYKVTTKNFTYSGSDGVTIVGNGAARKRFFGQSVPSFAFGKTKVKNEACRSFRPLIRQPTVLAMTRTKTREWLEKLDPEDWSITSFDPNKREVCILVEAGHGQTHLVTAELLLVGSGVGNP